MTEPDDILKQHGFGNDEQMKEALSLLDKLRPKTALSKEEAWARFEKSLNQQVNEEPADKKFSIGIIYKIAASLLIIIGLWFGFNNWNHVYLATSNGSIERILLPDGSSVTLNAASSLEYSKWNWKNSRKVKLSGEAFFKVNKGGNFEVSSSEKKVHVLGTEFNILSRNGYFEVKCISGKVEVQITRKEKVILDKGTALKQETADRAPEKYSITEKDASWIKGEFYYNNADLDLVLDEISRQFNVKISKNTSDRRYSGYFNKSNLSEALNNVCIPLGLTYSISKDSVIIKQGN